MRKRLKLRDFSCIYLDFLTDPNAFIYCSTDGNILFTTFFRPQEKLTSSFLYDFRLVLIFTFTLSFTVRLKRNITSDMKWKYGLVTFIILPRGSWRFLRFSCTQRIWNKIRRDCDNLDRTITSRMERKIRLGYWKTDQTSYWTVWYWKELQNTKENKNLIKVCPVYSLWR